MSEATHSEFTGAFAKKCRPYLCRSFYFDSIVGWLCDACSCIAKDILFFQAFFSISAEKDTRQLERRENERKHEVNFSLCDKLFIEIKFSFWSSWVSHWGIRCKCVRCGWEDLIVLYWGGRRYKESNKSNGNGTPELANSPALWCRHICPHICDISFNIIVFSLFNHLLHWHVRSGTSFCMWQRKPFTTYASLVVCKHAFPPIYQMSLRLGPQWWVQYFISSILRSRYYLLSIAHRC